MPGDGCTINASYKADATIFQGYDDPPFFILSTSSMNERRIKRKWLISLDYY